MKSKLRSYLSIAGLVGACLLGSAVNAEVLPGTNLSLDFQGAFIQGSGTKITAFKIPVTDMTTGKTTYFDAQFNFTIGANGITFDRTTYAQLAAVQSIGLGDFIPGTYSTDKIVTGASSKFTWTKTTGLSSDRDQLTLTGGTSTGSYVFILATGPLAGNPFTGADLQTNCSGTASSVGLFGWVRSYTGYSGGIPFGQLAYVRVRQIDAKTQQWENLSATCSVIATQLVYLQ